MGAVEIAAAVFLKRKYRKMTDILIISVLAFFVVAAVIFTVEKRKRGGGCCGERDMTKKRTEVKDKNKSHYPYFIKMKIGGMICENCSVYIENKLNSLEGAWATVDIGSHSAKVRLKAKPNERELMDVVASAGYVVLEIINLNSD